MSLTKVTPTPAGGSWTLATPPGISDPLTKVTPTPAGGSWTILTAPPRTGFHHIGLVRGARGVG